MDKEYIILENIDKNASITQRELSQKAGISLGSVNILLSKMIKEGLIKMERIPADRVLYMLTPKGMLEKMNKTYQYIKIHYNYIDKTKNRIKSILLELLNDNELLFVVSGNDEISQLVNTAVDELNNPHIIQENKGEVVERNMNELLICVDSKSFEEYKLKGYKVVNVLELL